MKIEVVTHNNTLQLFLSCDTEIRVNPAHYFFRRLF
jgi:hypothetical protein